MTTNHSAPAIVWFRDDLRVGDNPALLAATQTGLPVVCIYINDPKPALTRSIGAAVKWWLDGSLRALDEQLSALGNRLHIFSGSEEITLKKIVKSLKSKNIFWNRRYGATEITTDTNLKACLQDEGCSVQSFNANLLYEPWEVVSKVGAPMRVFTPFWKAARASKSPEIPLPAPEKIASINASAVEKLYAHIEHEVSSIEALNLVPTAPDWSGSMRKFWQRGEKGARKRLDTFLSTSLKGYAENRDRPDQDGTSRLSPYLRFGEISPRQIWQATHQAVASGASDASDKDVEKFLAEIGWREFSYHLLFYNPDLATKNFNARFDHFPWFEKPIAYAKWCRGHTGYPIVDAGMRQLWATGWMHNRVRMICASFLIKHLLINWRHGEDWFWDTLVDADRASNPASWQWVAGSGADAAPYFRIFNPIIQGQKFDPNGDYIRQWVPEIADIPTQYLHAPWSAPDVVLKRCGISLGRHYPKPIVDHDEARAKALKAFDDLKSAYAEHETSEP